MNFNTELSNCNSISDIFELVKKVCYKYLGKEQAGLLVGLSDLGKYPNGFLGAFYNPNANMIVINNKIINRNHGLYKEYMFHILLHEYLHSLGYYDEDQTRLLTLEISKQLENENIIKLAVDMSKYFPNIVLGDYQPIKDLNIQFVNRIDKRNTEYIG